MRPKSTPSIVGCRRPFRRGTPDPSKPTTDTLQLTALHHKSIQTDTQPPETRCASSPSSPSLRRPRWRSCPSRSRCIKPRGCGCLNQSIHAERFWGRVKRGSGPGLPSPRGAEAAKERGCDCRLPLTRNCTATITTTQQPTTAVKRAGPVFNVRALCLGGWLYAWTNGRTDRRTGLPSLDRVRHSRLTPPPPKPCIDRHQNRATWRWSSPATRRPRPSRGRPSRPWRPRPSTRPTTAAVSVGAHGGGGGSMWWDPIIRNKLTLLPRPTATEEGKCGSCELKGSDGKKYRVCVAKASARARARATTDR